ncbi:hypothetical protein Acr_29g0006340 [Actinidia rufa]|uniref:Uncharacterized protein n=1 Tax=Actinidia rufa TaxID=165716 RepID=A0A7J0FMC3_9ERIC|nr:hypothetical protein Acr_13g0009160 [Actinidia rufa]GFZ21472.1 hypothetical protein Acr_29g0006340 [Actinidia rufa]
MFVKDGPLRDHMKNSMLYEMTLEQRWENIFNWENNSYGQGNGSYVSLEVEVHREMVAVGGREAVWDENCGVDGVVWFRGKEVSLELSFLVVERMKWEEERGGWVRSEKRKVVVNRREEFDWVMGGGGGLVALCWLRGLCLEEWMGVWC